MSARAYQATYIDFTQVNPSNLCPGSIRIRVTASSVQSKLALHSLIQKLVTEYQAAHEQSKLASGLTEDIAVLELESVDVE